MTPRPFPSANSQFSVRVLLTSLTKYHANCFPAICRFSEPIAFNSILAYTYAMVKDLHDGDETDASFYAGLLVSAYAVAEALTAMGWGALSDRYGRKPIVLIGLGGVAISSLVFGLAKSYWVALLARFIGGALNGNVAVMQTMVAEMVKKPEHEREFLPPISLNNTLLTSPTAKAYAVQPFVWTLGGIFGSAMGGFLAQPARFYPGLFSPDSFWAEYPYLLPNLVAVVIIVLAIIQGAFFLEETNPKELQTDNAIDDNASVFDETSSLLAPRASIAGSVRRRSQASRAPRPSFIEEGLPGSVGQYFDIRKSSFATVHSIRFAPEEANKIRRDLAQGRPNTPRRTTGRGGPAAEYTGKAFNYTIIMLTLALVIVSFHSMAYLSLLPTWILDEPKAALEHLDLQGGLGMTVHDVGVYLAINGAVGLVIQAIIFPIFIEKVGIWKSFIWMVILFPIPYFMLPFITAGPANMTTALIYVSLFMQSFVGIIIYPAALILLKDATPSPQVLGKVNGLAMSGCCLARTISPPLVGIVYSAGGSGAAWFTIAGAAVVGIAQLPFIPRKHVAPVEVDNAFLHRTHSHQQINATDSAAAEHGHGGHGH
jgi:MFS family permease